MVKLSDGSERNLLDVMTNVMNFWQSYLQSIGIIQNIQNYTIPGEPKTRLECTGNKLDLEITRGLRFRQAFRLQKYNYSTGKIEPVDLTGSEVKFVIEPRVPFTVELAIKNETTEQEHKRTITLSDNETDELERMSTDEEKQDYLMGLPVVQQALHELNVEAGSLAPQELRP